MVSPALTSAAVGLGVGVTHYLAHTIAGDETDFEDAGVSAAGITVMIGSAVATYLVLVAGGLA